MKAIERIYQYIDNKGIKIVEFERKNSLSNGYLKKMLQRKGDLGESILNQILENSPEISPEWLLTGEGSMLKSEAKPSAQAKEKRLIPFFDDVATIGGHNSISASVDGCMPASEYIDAGDWFNGATAAIRHYGDSMVEYPSGCILALKLVQDKSQIILGANYCIETDEIRVTKRLQNGEDNDYFMAYSSNTDTYPDGTQIHQPFPIKKTSIRRLYLVLGCVVKQYSSGAVFIQK